MRRFVLIFGFFALYACGGSRPNEPSFFWHQTTPGEYNVWSQSGAFDQEIMWDHEGNGSPPVSGDGFVHVLKILSDNEVCALADSINGTFGGNGVNPPCDIHDTIWSGGDRYPLGFCTWGGEMDTTWSNTSEMLNPIFNQSDIGCSYLRYDNGALYFGGNFYHSDFLQEDTESCLITTPTSGGLIAFDDGLRPGSSLTIPAWLDSCGDGEDQRVLEFENDWMAFTPSSGGFGSMSIMRDIQGCGDYENFYSKDYGIMIVGGHENDDCPL